MPTPKKPSMADLLGTELTRMLVIKGRMHNLEDGSDCPKLWLKGADESKEDLYDNTYEYGFIDKAIPCVTDHSEFSEEDGKKIVYVDVPFPQNKRGINWVNDPF